MNKKFFSLFFIGFFLTACALPQSVTTVVNQPDEITIQPQIPQSPKSDAEITSPDLSKQISSPVTIDGTIARSYVFEATFPVVLKDGDGKEIARKGAAAQDNGNLSEMIPFSVTLDFKVPLTKTGTLILQADNPSGLPANDHAVAFPVTFDQTITLLKPLPKPEWTTYNNEKYSFQIKYPSSFSLGPMANPENQISIKYPVSYYQGTNLQDATINVDVTNNVDECSVSVYDKKVLTKTVVNNGITFYEDDWTEGAAGHKGDNIGYYTVYNGNCFKINLSMYSSNLENYSDGNGGYIPSAPAQFDRQKVVDVFKSIFETFKFTVK